MVFCLILKIKLLIPNKPVNNGNRGSFIIELFNTAIPKNPDKMKIKKAKIFLFIPCSVNIKNKEARIKIMCMIL